MTRGVFGTSVATSTALNDAFKPPYCYVYNNANISIANNTSTAVTFNTEDYDNLSMHSTSVATSRITVPADGTGRYVIGANIAFDTNATGYRQVSIKANGVSELARVQVPTVATAGVGTYVQCVTHASLSAGDYVEVYVLQNSGGALNIVASSRVGVAFWATWVSV